MCSISLLKLCMAHFMHVQVSESYEFVSHFISLCSRGGGELVLRIFSPPEKISGGRFCPVTPVRDREFVPPEFIR